MRLSIFCDELGYLSKNESFSWDRRDRLVTTSKNRALDFRDRLRAEGYTAHVIDQNDRIAYYKNKGWVER